MSKLSDADPVIDFYQIEFIEDAQRRVFSAKAEIEQIKSISSKLNDPKINDRINSISAGLMFFNKILEKITPMKNSNEFQEHFNDIFKLQLAIEMLRTIINQKLEGTAIFQRINDIPFTGILGTTQYIEKAADVFVEDLMTIIFGRQEIADTNEVQSILAEELILPLHVPTRHPPLTIFGLRYQSNSNLMVTFLDGVDRFRARHWVATAHEIFHFKLDLFFNALALYENENKRKKGLILLSKMIPEISLKYEVSKSNLNDHTNLITKKMETYRNAHLNLYSKISGLMRLKQFDEIHLDYTDRHVGSQINEIVCDIAATLIVGPSHLLHLTSNTIAEHFNPDHKKSISLKINKKHPSTSARYHIISRVLTHNLGYGSDVNISKLLKKLENPVYRGEDLFEEYLQKYLEAVDPELDNLIESIKILLNPEREIYGVDRWKKMVLKYQNILKYGTVSGIEPRDMLNILWIKRCDSYDRILNIGKSSNTLLQWRRKEHKLFDIAIKYLSSYHFDEVI